MENRNQEEDFLQPALKPPLTGKELLEAVKAGRVKREPLAEGFIYKGSVLMTTAPSGLGKSILTLQACLEMTCGKPVFGLFDVPKPVKIWYVMMERTKEEILERIEIMQETVPWNADNFILDDQCQTLDLTSAYCCARMAERGMAFNPDLVVIDPLYAGAVGLSEDKKAAAFCRFSSSLQAFLGCTNWLIHHNVKDSYAQDGKKIQKDDPFYGSTWLKAHPTAMFNIEKVDDDIIRFVNKKDSHNNLVHDFTLTFDHETYTASSCNDKTKISKKESVINTLNLFYRDKKTFKFSELVKRAGVSSGYCRDLVYSNLGKKYLTSSKGFRGERLYKVAAMVKNDV